ncbi:hypothetical protein [Klebsiella aerogenes]|uniref:hypothetical protein n=1 Tax=Klebsiella aerogenes TaxID=548 RepID=UPI0034D2FC8B
MPNAQAFNINLSGLEGLKAALGASHNQFVGAYNRALNRTLKKLYRKSISLFNQEISLEDKNAIEKRVKSYLLTKNINTGMSFSGLTLGSAKIWFGLNSFKVHELKGKIKGQKRVKQPRDPVTGRFLKTRKGARGASFMPKGKGLSAMSFPDSFAAEIKGVNSIWIRNSRGYIREAKVAIDKPMIDAISRYIFNNIEPVFWGYFEKDLRSRVSGNITFDPKTGKRV